MKSIDKQHIWHPYSSVLNPNDTFEVQSALGVYLELNDGRVLIDGMSSWWSAIHGYNNEVLNQAVNEQISKMSHVMFGGLTHEPAIELTQKLLDILHDDFEYIFYSDSGSVAIEVAMKMAIQYYYKNEQTKKNKFLTVKNAYHGDTFGAMSICDPENGMHKIFSDFLSQNYFVSAPKSKFNDIFNENELDEVKKVLEESSENIAAIIIEPIMQGAGGMRIYHPDYLKGLKELSLKYDVLLIFDEIATGFGRTGKLFAYEHTGITPDIIAIGKALTGGYLSMAATITTKKVAKEIEKDGHILMHGPTFMANPLSCKVASTSIDLLLQSNWQENVLRIESYLKENLMICTFLPTVKDIRIIGAIAVVELVHSVDLKKATDEFVKRGVWIRPYMNLIYIMPPFIIQQSELQILINAIYETIQILE